MRGHDAQRPQLSASKSWRAVHIDRRGNKGYNTGPDGSLKTVLSPLKLHLETLHHTVVGAVAKPNNEMLKGRNAMDATRSSL